MKWLFSIIAVLGFITFVYSLSGWASAKSASYEFESAPDKGRLAATISDLERDWLVVSGLGLVTTFTAGAGLIREYKRREREK